MEEKALTEKERVEILGIAEELSVRSDVDWINNIVARLRIISKSTNYIRCPRCNGVGVILRTSKENG